MKACLLLLASLITLIYAIPDTIVAYIPSWTTDYTPPCNLNLETLNVNYFTHLLVPFASFDTTNFALSAMNGDDTSGWYTKVLALKSKNTNLKVLYIYF